VQTPGGEGKSSGGQPEFIDRSRAPGGDGVDGVFLEVHDNPAKALSDGRMHYRSTSCAGCFRASWNSRPWRGDGVTHEPGYCSPRAAHRGRRHRRSVRAPPTNASTAPSSCYFNARAASRDGNGKIGTDRAQDCGDVFEYGHAIILLHPAEALHGDLGMLMREDVVLAVSYGGETEEIVALLPTLQRNEISLIALTGQPGSTLAKASRVALDVSVKEEACSLNLAPTASTTAALAMGRRSGDCPARPAWLQVRPILLICIRAGVWVKN